MPDQLFILRATEGVAPLAILASDAGSTRFPTQLPFSRLQASKILRPTLDPGGQPDWRAPLPPPAAR